MKLLMINGYTAVDADTYEPTNMEICQNKIVDKKLQKRQVVENDIVWVRDWDDYLNQEVFIGCKVGKKNGRRTIIAPNNKKYPLSTSDYLVDVPSIRRIRKDQAILIKGV